MTNPSNEPPLETDADVVIVGGGIIGTATAFYLAREGLKTVLVDKGAIGYEQSTRNWGWVHQQVRYPHLIPLAMRSVELWQTLDEALGSPVEFVQGGNLSLAFSEDDLTLFEEIASDARDAGLTTRVIDRAATAAVVPEMEGDWTGALHVLSDGQANPTLVTAAFARAAGEAGAYLYTGCAAERVELTAGAVSGVVTERGLIRTPIAVCAGGAWAARFARRLGVKFPQRSVRSTVVRTTAVKALTAATAWGDGFTFRQDSAGRFILAGGAAAIYDIDLELLRDLRRFLPLAWHNRRWIRFHLGRPLRDDLARLMPGSAARRDFWQHRRAIDPPPDDRAARESLQKFQAMFPSLGDAQPEEIWAGNIDTTPDQAPAIDAVGPTGFLLAAGFSGHGFALGPAGAELASQLARGVDPTVNPRPFRHARFAENDLPPLRAYPR